MITLVKSIDVFLIDRVDDAVAEYNIRRVLKLIAAVLIGLIVISVLFINWYAAVVSLGVFSVIIGLALQTTFTSFIGWIYILIRSPYRVGDRIRLGDGTGDVIDVGYLDTTLWEFGGDFLSTDHPSGRVIRFPNSKEMERQEEEHRSRQDWAAARLTDFSGSMAFVYIHALWFGLWVALNLGLFHIPHVTQFDPFPFGLLTLIVSLEAIFLSTFVLIAQNNLSA